MGDPNSPILPGCYYPGCNDEHQPGQKFCTIHGGSKRMKAPKIKAPKIKAPAAEPTAPSTPKKAKAKKAKAKAKKAKATKSKPVKRTNLGKGNGTERQKAAAKMSQNFSRFDWTNEIARFMKSSKKDLEVELGSAGSAQVTRVRLTRREDCKGLSVSTHGAWLTISKGGE